MTLGQLQRLALREVVGQMNARDALIVRTTYTHVVYYRSQDLPCYMGAHADCVRFANDCGECRVTLATDEQVNAEVYRILAWRPYGYR